MNVHWKYFQKRDYPEVSNADPNETALINYIYTQVSQHIFRLSEEVCIHVVTS